MSEWIADVLLGFLATSCHAQHTSYGHTMGYGSRIVPYSLVIGLQVCRTGAGVFIVAVLQEAAARVSMERTDTDKVINI